MHRYSRLTALLFAAAFSLCPSGSAFAQADVPAARKHQEFGDIQASDLAARLDHFANELQAHPDAKGFVIAYRSRRDLPGLSGRLMHLMRNYLIDNRQIAAERVIGVDGGSADCIAQELWVVPVGATPTPRADAYENDFVDTDVARKFDEAALFIPDNFPEPYHQHIYHSFEGFATALRKEPRSNAHVIAYPQYWVERLDEENERGVKKTQTRINRDPPGLARKALALAKSELVKKYGIASSRIRLVNGGYRKWATLELWIVPPGAHAPIPTPNAFPRGRR